MLTSFCLLSPHSPFLLTTSLPHKFMTASYFLFLYNNTHIETHTHSHTRSHNKKVLSLFYLYILMFMVNQGGHILHSNFSNSL